MLIARCSWHRQHFGGAKFMGVRSWRGWRVEFTDGLCALCAGIVRAAALKRLAERAREEAAR